MAKREPGAERVAVQGRSTTSARPGGRGTRLPAQPDHGAESAIALVETARALTRAAARAAGAGVRRELTGAQMEVLLEILRHPDQTVSELAERLRLARNTVSTLIGQLVRADLIARTSDEVDARVARLSLTPAAAARMAGWRARRSAAVHDALAALAARDRAAIERALMPLSTLVTAIESASARSR